MPLTKAQVKEILKVLPKKVYRVSGKDCECYAYNENECGCGADWTNHNEKNKTIDDCISAIKSLEREK